MVITGNSGAVYGWIVAQCEMCDTVIENGEYANTAQLAGRDGAWARTVYTPCACGRYVCDGIVTVGNVPTDWF